jgi:hypothetical protein
MLNTFGYVVESTGADSPSQNGGAEIYKKPLAVKTRTLLYGAGLSSKFWSIALLHSVYLHNCLVHSATNKTPYEGCYVRKPDITHLKTFGSRVCVKHTGSRQCKLYRQDFTGIFLVYTATDQNIIYLDLDSGVVKSCHHAVFDEAWYLQPTRPPAAQLLYDLGLEAETNPMTTLGPVQPTPPGTVTSITVSWPPPLTELLNKGLNKDNLWTPPPRSLYAPLPLRVTPIPDAARTPHTVNARAACLQSRADTQKRTAAEVVSDYLINSEDMAMIYMSPDPYATVFEEELDV